MRFFHRFGLAPAPRFPPPGSILSPPPSPNRRRRALRESEDTEGNLPIEAYLVRADPFRSSTLLYPLPYPLQYSDPNQALKIRLREYLPLIERAVSEHFTVYHIDLHSVTKPGYPGGDRATQLLLIRVVDQNSQGKYGLVKDQVRSILSTSDLSMLDCEVVDLRRCYQPSLFPISPNSAAVRHYENAEAEMLQILRNMLKTNWRMMSLFNVGADEATAAPALVVMVRPGTECDWPELEYRLSACMRGVGALDMQVEFLPGGCFRSMAGAPGVSFRDRLTDAGFPKADSSIGVKGELGGGTLGGFIQLERENLVHNGFLTNFHVVQPSANVASHKAQKGVERFGDPYFSRVLDSKGTEVFYLARKDVDASVQETQEAITGTQELLDNLTADIEQRELIGRRVPPHYDDLVSTYTEELASWRRQFGVFNSMPTRLGRVLTSSGCAVDEHRRVLDWAFVELQDPKAKEHMQPNFLPSLALNLLPSRFIDGADDRIRLIRHVTSIAIMKPGEWYMKNGRTSQVTAGVCNGTAAYLQWPESEKPRYNLNGEEVESPKGAETKELIILSKARKAVVTQQASFCLSGDSGSWVINAQGHLCGLLFGEVTGWCGPSNEGSVYVNAGIVSCMSTISDSVCVKTKGGNLRLP